MARLENPAGIPVGGAPAAHKTSHEPGGTDVLTLLTDASVAAGNKDGAAGTASLRTLGPGAAQAIPGPFVGVWRNLMTAGGKLTTADTAIHYFGTNGGRVVPGTNSANPPVSTYQDDEDYLVSGLTTSLRLLAVAYTNATAPTGIYTAGLYPITAVAGGTGGCTFTFGTVVTGSTVAFSSPAASTLFQGKSSTFVVPADGWYCVGVANDTSIAALADMEFVLHLQMAHT